MKSYFWSKWGGLPLLMTIALVNWKIFGFEATVIFILVVIEWEVKQWKN